MRSSAISFAVFLLAYVLSQFYRSFLAVIAPELASELHLNPQALGNLQAWWIAGFVAAQFPVGWALDRLGPRHTVSILMISAIAGAALFAHARSEFGLDCAMVMIGIGCAPIYMGAVYIFGRINRPEQFALLCSWLLGFGSAGNLLAASPLAWAASTIGWRASMLAIAAATGGCALLVFFVIRDPPVATSSGEHRGWFHSILDILTIRPLWPLLPLTAIGYSVVIAERGLWAGPYFSEVHGLAALARGNALLAMAAAMSLGAMIYGPLDNWLGTRKWIVFSGSSVTAALFLYLGWGHPGVAGATATIALLGGFGMTYGVLMAHARAFFPEHLLGRGITFMNVMFLGGAGLLQPLSGAMVTSLKATGASAAETYSALHLTFGILLAFGCAIYLLSREASVTREIDPIRKPV